MTAGLGAGTIHAAEEGPAPTGTEQGEWRFIGGDSAHTRFSPAAQITPENFEDLEDVWVWDGASFDAASGRSTPVYADGILYTVAGPRRHVIALDPETGELLWSYREPHTERYQYSMRKDYGKGIAFAEIDGRKIVYIISPGFFLTALDAKTGRPLEGFGKKVPVEGFPETGVVDLLANFGFDYDPYYGIDKDLGYITASSPPIVVGDVIVIGNSAEQGYNQSREEGIPGDILGYDARTGEFLWKFNVVPRPGEFGAETWEDGSWVNGEVSSWAPMAADQDRGIVYIPTNSGTIDFYGGHRPGDNLFGTSLIALDVKTGKRAWHFQLVHHDIWNYDTPTAPVLLDVEHEGKPTPIVVQVTKQSFAYAFNRVTGEPLWPIEERPVPQSLIPGEQLSETQPFPTKPAPYDNQGLTYDDLIDWTPELRAKAVDIVDDFVIGPLFNPPLHRDNELGKLGSIWCPGDIGGVNIDGPAVADPNTGILYVVSRKHCTTRIIAPGEERDAILDEPTGTTVAPYAVLRNMGVRGPDDLPLFKPPFSRITAIDMNTGEHLWYVPVGEMSDRIRQHPALAGMDLPNGGSGTVPPMTVTPNMVMYASTTGDGTPHLFAIDKKTGAELAMVEVPEESRYGMMTYMHEGRQYVMLQTGPRLTAMALPSDAPVAADDH